MATVDATGKPHTVPICYVYVSGLIYTPIDIKPKSVPAYSLGRIKNICSNPFVSIVIDKYYEDWDRLYYVKISGRASLLEDSEEYDNSLMSLCEKYAQYGDMNLLSLALPVIRVMPLRIVSWGDVPSGSYGG